MVASSSSIPGCQAGPGRFSRNSAVGFVPPSSSSATASARLAGPKPTPTRSCTADAVPCVGFTLAPLLCTGRRHGVGPLTRGGEPSRGAPRRLRGSWSFAGHRPAVEQAAQLVRRQDGDPVTPACRAAPRRLPGSVCSSRRTTRRSAARKGPVRTAAASGDGAVRSRAQVQFGVEAGAGAALGEVGDRPPPAGPTGARCHRGRRPPGRTTPARADYG